MSKREAAAAADAVSSLVEPPKKKTNLVVTITNVATKQAIAEGYIRLYYGRGVNEKHPETNQTPLSNAIDKKDSIALFLLLEVLPSCYNNNRNNQDGIIVNNNIIDTNAKNMYGNTALHCALLKNLFDVAKMLIYKGAKIEETNRYMKRPLHYACQNGATEIVKLLIERGADVNAKCREGISPLVYACRALPYDNTQFEITKLLLDHGADVNYTNTYGENEALRSAICHSPKTSKLLLENGASTEYMLHLACQRGIIWAVKLLLDNGADINGLDGRGNPPLQFAFQAQRGHVFKFLLEKGADVSLWNPEK